MLRRANLGLPYFLRKVSMRLERFKTVFASLSILGFVVILASFLISGLMTRGAVLAQRIEPNEAASLFGDSSGPGTPIGSPQWVVIRDEKAFLEGQSADGARFVNEEYLIENKIYPLQVKTVEFFRNVTAVVAVLGVLVMASLWLMATRGLGEST